MALPKIVVHNRKVILLSGFTAGSAEREGRGEAAISIDAEAKLLYAVKKYPDATAFGYVAGQWVAGA